MLKLADKYQVKDVVELVKGRIDSASVNISLDKVLEVLEVTQRYKDLLNFDEVCDMIARRCAISLRDACPAGVDIAYFISANQDKIDLVLLLVNKVNITILFLNELFISGFKLHCKKNLYMRHCQIQKCMFFNKYSYLNLLTK